MMMAFLIAMNSFWSEPALFILHLCDVVIVAAVMSKKLMFYSID